MPQTDILSNDRLFPDSTYSRNSTDYLADFERAIGSFVRAWVKYQPDDSLAAERKQDLEWLKLTLRDYRLNIHNSSNSCKFWQGCMEGKDSRRTLSDQTSKSLGQILLKAITATKAQQIYELGVQVGWRYVRLKDYLQRLKKQRKLEEAQQLQDYQQFFDSLRRKDETNDTDSFLSFGWVQKRKFGK